MTIREATTDDDAAIGRVYGECYGDGEPFTGSIAGSPGNRSFVLEDHHGIQGAYRIWSQRHYWDNGEMTSGGIGGVAVLPRARKAGYAAAMMRHSLQTMREADLVLSTLFPFSYNYYRKFGWEWVGSKLSQVADFSLLKPFTDAEGVRSLATDEMRLLRPIYDQFARRYRGCVVRDDVWWDRRLARRDGPPLLVYAHEGRSLDGYMLFTLNSGDTMNFREWVALNPEAYRAMLGFVGVHYMRYTKFGIPAPSDDPLRMLMFDDALTVTLEPVTQARVVNVPAAVSLLHPNGSGEFTFAIEDADADWNRGPWKVQFSDGRTEIAHASEADIRMDIQTFSQAFHGDPSAGTLRNAGRIAISDEAAFTAFWQLFSPAVVFTMDYF